MIKLFLDALLVTASLAISLLAAEGIIRMTSLSGIYVAETGNQYKFYEFDDRLGWKNSPGRFGQYTRDEFSYQININSHGMRYREVSPKKSPNITRVVVLGDSFTWGIGVADQERFTEMVEKKTDGKYELLNFGVSGYGPIQYYLMIDEIIEDFHPEIVLIAFCLSNDFADNIFWRRYNYYKPYLLENKKPNIVISGYPIPRSGELATGPLSDWLADHSRLYSLVRGKVKTTALQFADYGQAGINGADENQMDIYFPKHSTEASELADRMVALNAKLIRQIRDKAKRQNVQLAVVVAPTKCEYGACFQGERARNMNARNYLLKTLKELDIPVIDKTDAIDSSDFWKTDGHWRPSGHEKIADGIVDWLNGRKGSKAR